MLWMLWMVVQMPVHTAAADGVVDAAYTPPETRMVLDLVASLQFPPSRFCNSSSSLWSWSNLSSDLLSWSLHCIHQQECCCCCSLLHCICLSLPIVDLLCWSVLLHSICQNGSNICSLQWPYFVCCSSCCLAWLLPLSPLVLCLNQLVLWHITFDGWYVMVVYECCKNKRKRGNYFFVLAILCSIFLENCSHPVYKHSMQH